MAFSFPLRSEKESFRNPIFNQTLESSFGQFKVSPPSSYFVREDVQPFDLKCQLIKDDEFEIILNCPEKRYYRLLYPLGNFRSYILSKKSL